MAMIDESSGAKLLAAARATIHEALGGPHAAIHPESWMTPPTATFVTLRQADELRGCVGSIVARQALIDDVRSNALGAAFRDPRFTPLVEHELPHTRIEIAILSTPVEIAAASETEAIANLERGVDGVVFHMGPLRSVFLPQVWNDLPDPHEFFAHLKRKAGLADDYWSSAVRVEKFRTEKFIEPISSRKEMLS